MPIKFVRRWLFGREIGALLHISQHTEWGIGGRNAAGMSLKGTSQPGGFHLKAGAIPGAWEVVNSRNGIDHLDVYVAEKGLAEFVEGLKTSDRNLLEAGKLLGLFDYEKLHREIATKIMNPRTHLGPATPAMEELDLWVRTETINKHPELAGDGVQEEES